MKTRTVVSFSMLSAAIAVAFSGCQTSFRCDELESCVTGGSAGAGNGGTSSSTSGAGSAGLVCCSAAGQTGNGGTTSGGANGAGTSQGGVSATGGAPPCNVVCAGATPVCDEASHQCVACSRDVHCPSTAPACDTADHVCVGCILDSHCSGATPVCDTGTNRCVACTKDANCSGPTPACKLPGNTCVACTANSHCTAPKGVCATDNTCIECQKSADCTYSATKPACRTESKTCVECVTSADCKDPTKSVCDTLTNTCVGCLASADCADSTKPGYNASRLLCKPETKACVSCLANADCKTAGASRCDLTAGSPSSNTCLPCSADADCSQVTGKTVCLSGVTAQPNQCVQCTGKKSGACGQLLGKALVCDSLAHTCSPDKTAQSSGLCQPCIADAQCPAGQLCYQETFGGRAVGYFCFWKRGDTANGAPAACSDASSRPYVKIETDVTSIDAEVATLCTLASSTCVAYNQFKNLDCAPGGTPQDALCGFAAGQDSKCMPYDAGYRCTTVCSGNDDCNFTCNLGASPKVCTFQ